MVDKPIDLDRAFDRLAERIQERLLVDRVVNPEIRADLITSEIIAELASVKAIVIAAYRSINNPAWQGVCDEDVENKAH